MYAKPVRLFKTALESKHLTITLPTPPANPIPATSQKKVKPLKVKPPSHLRQASAAESRLTIPEVDVQEPSRALKLQIRGDCFGDVGARAVQLP